MCEESTGGGQKSTIVIDELLSILKKAEEKLISSHKSIDSVPYNGLSESYMERLYINSDGAKRYMKLSQSSIYLYAKAVRMLIVSKTKRICRIFYCNYEECRAVLRQ